VIAKGQVWALESGLRFVVESDPDHLNRLGIRDEETGARVNVHIEFLNGKKLVEARATIPSDERSFA
jgi:hypothetical protein